MIVVSERPTEPLYWRAKWLLAAIKCYLENEEYRNCICKEIGIDSTDQDDINTAVNQGDINEIFVRSFIKAGENTKQNDINTILMTLLNQSLELMAKYVEEDLMLCIGVWKRGDDYYVILNPNVAKKVRRRGHDVAKILNHLKKTLEDINDDRELKKILKGINKKLSELADKIDEFIDEYDHDDESILGRMKKAYYNKYSDTKDEMWYSDGDIDKAIEAVEKFDKNIVSLVMDISIHVPKTLTVMKRMLSEIQEVDCIPEKEVKEELKEKYDISEKELQEIINFVVKYGWIERKDGRLKWVGIKSRK